MINTKIWIPAKEEYKRTEFNEMIEICKKKEIDFIIIDEPKRLSRNNIDTSCIIDLMDKKQIWGIYATSRQYLSENPRDKFLLQLDLSLSKMDNEGRSIDIRNKMLTCAKRWQCLVKAPFWYKNITIRKWHKSVEIIKDEAKIVKEIFELRASGFVPAEIIRIINSKYQKIKRFSKSSMSNLLHNKFYIGITTFAKQEFKWEHSPIISMQLFEKVQEMSPMWLFIRKHDRNTIFLLKGFLKDENWSNLHAYKSKWYSYYKTNNRTTQPVNIREEIILDKCIPFIMEFDKNWKFLQKVSEKMIEEIIEKYKIEQEQGLQKITNEIKEQQERISSLFDLRLEKQISAEIFEQKNAEIMKKIQHLNSEKGEILCSKHTKIWKILKKCLELSKSLLESYNQGDISYKVQILKNISLELSINNKKELKIKENKLFKMIKLLEVQYGGPGGTRTLDLRLKRPLL